MSRDPARSPLRPVLLLSNLCVLVAVVFVILWPVTGSVGFLVVGLALLVLGVALAGVNMAQRKQRLATRRETR